MMMIDGWWSFFCIEVINELLLDIVIGINDFHTKRAIRLTDLQSQSQKPLVVRDVKAKLQLFLAEDDPSLKGLVDILIEVVPFMIVIHIMKLKEVKAK